MTRVWTLRVEKQQRGGWGGARFPRKKRHQFDFTVNHTSDVSWPCVPRSCCVNLPCLVCVYFPQVFVCLRCPSFCLDRAATMLAKKPIPRVVGVLVGFLSLCCCYLRPKVFSCVPCTCPCFHVAPKVCASQSPFGRANGADTVMLALPGPI